MALYLNRERMQVTDRNDRGVITFTKTYLQGQEVDTSHLDEDHVNNLVEGGFLVDSPEKVTGRHGSLRPYQGSQVTGAATGEPADHSEIEGAAGPEEPTGNDVQDDDGEDVDAYSSMDYGQLQEAAKEADIPANQSAANLRAALREHDAS